MTRSAAMATGPNPPPHEDQAAGLRQLFAARHARFVALAHNPAVAHAGVAMERLTAVWSERGLRTLVVDAAPGARAPGALAEFDLAACIESLSPLVGYLAARGVPPRWLDARGSTAGFLGAVADAAPAADVVLVHAGAADLVRLFGQGPSAAGAPATANGLRPLLLADGEPASLQQAYAALKLLALRRHVAAFDLLLLDEAGHARHDALAQRLADTAERFVGATLFDWVAIDPAQPAHRPPGPPLRRLALAQLRRDDEAELVAAAAH